MAETTTKLKYLYELPENLFQPSGRLALAINDEKQLGFSCNFAIVEDSLDSITNVAYRWPTFISSRNGAPSLDFTQVRGKGSPIGHNGGISSGVVPFMLAADRAITAQDREHNKNKAGLIGLDASHPDLEEFLAAKFITCSKVVYLTNGTYYPQALLERLYQAFIEQPRLFMHKRMSFTTGTNLCTEIVDMTSHETCMLASFNLGYYTSRKDLKENFANDFYKAALNLVSLDYKIKVRNRNNPLYKELVNQTSDNFQVGLSVVGLATLLANIGVDYTDFPNSSVARIIKEGYEEAAYAVKKYFPQYKRVFCQAPTVHSHRRFYSDATGERLSITPSIEPLEGATFGEYAYANIVSSVKGNDLRRYNKNTANVQNVTNEQWQKVAEWFQSTFNDTKLGQGISYSVYSKTQDDGTQSFDYAAFTSWLHSNLRSLYYFVPVVDLSQELVEAKQANTPIDVSDELLEEVCNRFTDFENSSCDCAG